MKTTRRQFLSTASTAFVGAGILLGAAACSDDSAEDGTGGGSGTQDCSGSSITANHGHSLTVPAADVDAAVTKTYSIAGSSAHDHEVELTAANFADLAAGMAVTVTSTDGAGHTHDVTVTC